MGSFVLSIRPAAAYLSTRFRHILLRSRHFRTECAPSSSLFPLPTRILSSIRSANRESAYSTSLLPRLVPILAASAAALALCEQAFSDAPYAGITWPSLLQQLRDVQQSHSLQSGFTAMRRPLNESTHAWSFQITFPISQHADIYALLTTLATALAIDTTQSSKLDVDESPTRTVLTVSHDAFHLQLSVPRLGGFDSSVSVELMRVGPDATFSQREVDALMRAYVIGQATTQHEDGLLDGKNSVDVGPRTILDRGQARPPQRSHPYQFENERSAAWNKLVDMGVEVFDGTSSNLSWDALAGYDQVKKRIDDTLVLPLSHPEVYESIVKGTRKRFESNLPKAILYEGPPGCGKTLSAKILAASIGVPFVHVPLETILSKYYGETTKTLADILHTANQLGRCVVFIDECDTIGLSRDSSTEIHEVTRRTLSVLLRHIDGMDGAQNTILLAATNHKEDIDSALMSRFDVVVRFPLPDLETRAAILSLYAKQLSDEDLKTVAKISEGFSGRELLDVCEEAERTHGGSVVRRNPQGTEDVGLPVVEEYIAAVSRKAAHVVGRQGAGGAESREGVRGRLGKPAQSVAT